MDTATDAPARKEPSPWITILLAALAGGMGWGIRGQYGHQTGAMIAGVLVAFVIALRFCPGMSSLSVARIVAFTAVGIAFGGSMTYGQTMGLTHDADFHGNWSALTWGMTGLFVKGGIWIGFGGAFLGMALSTKRYRMLDLALLFPVLIGLMFLGVFLLNQPFDIENRRLPAIYFSGSWYWQPNKADLRPRFENWGGLLFALIGLTVYLGVSRKDVLARNIALIAFLAGGLGFAGGQCLPAYHAWNVERFQQGWFAPFEPYMNWWNTMETTFGLILGAGLALGVWCNRRLIGPKEGAQQGGEEAPELTPRMEALFLAMHVAALIAWEFLEFGMVERMADLALPMGFVPALAIVGGRYFPYAMTLPAVVLPIAGKTLREMSYKTDQIPVVTGWLLFILLPLGLLAAAAWLSAQRGRQGEEGGAFARRGLLLTSWVFFWLNFGFFQFPWPWGTPTYRSSSALAFTLCLVGLTAAALQYRRKAPGAGAPANAVPA